MELETLTVLMAIAGAVVLYGAITNRNPLDVIKLTLQGKDISAARTISTGLAAKPDNEATQGGPQSVDSLDASGFIDDLLSNIGIDGSTVIIPYAGHPIGSNARSLDVPGFMGGVAGKNSSYPTSDPRYNGGDTDRGNRGGSGHF
jgi:hypothetical protein